MKYITNFKASKILPRQAEYRVKIQFDGIHDILPFRCPICNTPTFFKKCPCCGVKLIYGK